MTIVVLEVQPEQKLNDDQSKVDPQGRLPREQVLCRLRAVYPNDEARCGRACDGKMKQIYVTQRKRKSQTLPFVFVQDADAADYGISMHHNGTHTASEKLHSAEKLLWRTARAHGNKSRE